MDNTEARQILESMLSTGILKIITNEHTCGGGQHPENNGFNKKKCGSFKFPITDSRHFVIHNVISLEESPSKNGLLVAYSDEGDMCMGYPVELLKRLTEASLKA